WRLKFFLGYALIVVFVVTLSALEARNFYVGEKDGWVVNPHESYSHWAKRNRFQVNDTLVFMYKNGYDAVLVVNAEGYNHCDLKHPIFNLSSGHTFFKLHESGHHYFISGIASHCHKSQKLHVVVLSPNHKKHTPPVAPKTPLAATPPSYSKAPLAHPPPAPKISSAFSPPSHSKAPIAHHPEVISPVHPPAANPAGWESPAPAPAPIAASASGLVSSLGVVLGLSGSVAALVLASIF
ncbi:hypothetical protein Drorol1_Dr00003954, partial [Drosera rotundifolia]